MSVKAVGENIEIARAADVDAAEKRNPMPNDEIGGGRATVSVGDNLGLGEDHKGLLADIKNSKPCAGSKTPLMFRNANDALSGMNNGLIPTTRILFPKDVCEYNGFYDLDNRQCVMGELPERAEHITYINEDLFDEAMLFVSTSIDPMIIIDGNREILKSQYDCLVQFTRDNGFSLSGSRILEFDDTGPSVKLENGRVVEIDFFAGPDITDINALKGLTSLRRLSLTGTEIRDISALKELADLEYLDLSGGRGYVDNLLDWWSGAPITDISALQGLTKLRELNLNWTKVHDVTPLKGLIDLKKLDLGATQVSDISDLRNLTGLNYLNLNYTKVHNIDALEGLTDLRELDLGTIQIPDIRALKGLTELRVLDLSGFMEASPLHDISALAGMTKLKQLDLSGTSVSNLGPLGNLTDLEVLDLGPLIAVTVSHSLPISDVSALKELSNLRKLDISGAPLSDISSLCGLKKLRELDLSGTQVDDISALNGLTNLEVLNLGSVVVSHDDEYARKSTAVDDISPLRGLNNLRDLNLDRTKVSDISPLFKLWNLRFLSLYGTQVSEDQITRVKRIYSGGIRVYL